MATAVRERGEKAQKKHHRRSVQGISHVWTGVVELACSGPSGQRYSIERGARSMQKHNLADALPKETTGSAVVRLRVCTLSECGGKPRF